MADRLREFLAETGWSDAQSVPLAGDASARRYLRLQRFAGHDSAVLMITAPDAAPETARFVAIARHLSAAGLSAPRVLRADVSAGLVLLEDFGDALVARLANARPDREPALYTAAVETLAALQRIPIPAGLASPDADDLAAMIAPLADWYVAGSGDTAPVLAAELRPLLAEVLDGSPRVLAHRDFHAENLLWLPDRQGPAQIGLLDFQDAFAGPPVYDLVSLVEDARRDLGPGLRALCLRRFANLTGTAVADLERHCAIVGAQRNLRILGIFARLARQAGKPRYLDLIPRVWGHLGAELDHPALHALRREVERLVPQPDAAHLDRLRTAWQTVRSR